MRRWLLLSLMGFGVAAAAQATEFGVADWGDMRESVLNREERTNRTPLGTSDYLIFEADLPGVHWTRIVYQFGDGQLQQGRFLFQTADSAPTQAWIHQFEQVKALISQQYGAPRSEHHLTPTGSGELPPGQWATALEADRLILKTTWVTEHTEIVQQLAWNGSTPHHQVIYRPLDQMASDTGGSAF